MAARKPLVHLGSGRFGELPSADTIAGYTQEAPSDNKTYGRKNGAWTEVTSGGATSATIIATHTIDMPALSQNAEYTFDVTVSGAELNDVVAVSPPAGFPGYFIIQGWVQSLNTVRVQIRNVTSYFDPASQVWKVAVIKNGGGSGGGGSGPSLSSSLPVASTIIGSSGTSSEASRADHSHPLGNLEKWATFTPGATASIPVMSTAGTLSNAPLSNWGKQLLSMATPSEAESSMGLASAASLALKIDDAPSNGSQYARRNGAWEVVSGGGGSLNLQVKDIYSPSFAQNTSRIVFRGLTSVAQTAPGDVEVDIQGCIVNRNGSFINNNVKVLNIVGSGVETAAVENGVDIDLTEYDIRTSWSAIMTNSVVGSHRNYMVDTSAGPITLTMPSNPQQGEIIRFTDLKNTFSTNALTISAPSIMNIAEPMVCSISGISFGLIYMSNTWRII